MTLYSNSRERSMGGQWPHVVAILATLLCVPSSVFAQEQWIATWTTAPQSLSSQPRRPAAGQVPTPVLAPQTVFNGQTVRMIVRASIGGHSARVQLSNAFSSAPLEIGAAHLALRDKDAAIVVASDRTLTFGGRPGIRIPPGADVVSDPVEIDVAPLSDLAISLYVPNWVPQPTLHIVGLHTTYISAWGDFTAAPTIIDAPATTEHWYMLSAVQVLAPAEASVVVALGDSITDGAFLTPNTDSNWPSQLARRLQANKTTSKIAVANQGIAGNRLLSEGGGLPALARFDRDVLAQRGVRWLILLEGINDIRAGALNPAQAVTADDIIGAYKQLIARAHTHGIKVIGATILPYAGSAEYNDAGEAMRTAVNEWIRTSGAYDAVVDMDAVVRDPRTHQKILAAYDVGDHLHPNDVGHKAIADAVDIEIFTKR